MELWVRSQDKELLMKTPELRYKQKGNVHSLLAYDTSGGYRILGVYKSKERAIEVLDEIQNILKPKYILNTSSIKPDGDFYEENGVIFQKYNANARIQELSTFVYQMPAE